MPIDLFGNWHCTTGSEESCGMARHPKCSCGCNGYNHGKCLEIVKEIIKKKKQKYVKKNSKQKAN